MMTTAKGEEVCLASTDGEEFEANALAAALGEYRDVAELVELGPLEAMGFADMLKVSIALLKAKIAIYEAALVRVEVAIESFSPAAKN